MLDLQQDQNEAIAELKRGQASILKSINHHRQTENENTLIESSFSQHSKPYYNTEILDFESQQSEDEQGIQLVPKYKLSKDPYKRTLLSDDALPDHDL